MSCGACGEKTKQGVAAAIGSPVAVGGVANVRHCPRCGGFLSKDGQCRRCGDGEDEDAYRARRSQVITALPGRPANALTYPAEDHSPLVTSMTLDRVLGRKFLSAEHLIGPGQWERLWLHRYEGVDLAVLDHGNSWIEVIEVWPKDGTDARAVVSEIAAAAMADLGGDDVPDTQAAWKMVSAAQQFSSPQEATQHQQEHGGQIYTWHTTGDANWLERGASVVDALAYVVLPEGKPDHIELPDDEEIEQVLDAQTDSY